MRDPSGAFMTGPGAKCEGSKVLMTSANGGPAAAIYNRADGGGNGVNGTSNAPTGNNNGDNPGTVGDKGYPRGTYGGTAYSGEPGKGGRGTSPGSGRLSGFPKCKARSCRRAKRKWGRFRG